MHCFFRPYEPCNYDKGRRKCPVHGQYDKRPKRLTHLCPEPIKAFYFSDGVPPKRYKTLCGLKLSQTRGPKESLFGLRCEGRWPEDRDQQKILFDWEARTTYAPVIPSQVKGQSILFLSGWSWKEVIVVAKDPTCKKCARAFIKNKG